AQLVTPDVGAAAFGVAAGYAYRNWLQEPRWSAAVLAGLVLGLAELTKATWVVLFPLWAVLWAAWRWPELRGAAWPGRLREAGQLAVVLLLGLYVINLGYGFEGSWQRLR